MRARKRNAALALVVFALAITWTVAGCAVVLPGGRPDGMPARVVFPVHGADPVQVPVTYPEAGITMLTRRMAAERAQFDPSGGILFVDTCRATAAAIALSASRRGWRTAGWRWPSWREARSR